MSFCRIPSREYTETVENVHCLIVVVTNTIDKFDHHTTTDIQDITLYLLRKVDDLLRSLRHGPRAP